MICDSWQDLKIIFQYWILCYYFRDKIKRQNSLELSMDILHSGFFRQIFFEANATTVVIVQLCSKDILLYEVQKFFHPVLRPSFEFPLMQQGDGFLTAAVWSDLAFLGCFESSWASSTQYMLKLVNFDFDGCWFQVFLTESLPFFFAFLQMQISLTWRNWFYQIFFLNFWDYQPGGLVDPENSLNLI